MPAFFKRRHFAPFGVFFPSYGYLFAGFGDSSASAKKF